MVLAVGLSHPAGQEARWCEQVVQRAIASGVAVFAAVWLAITLWSWLTGTPSWRGGVVAVVVWLVLVVRGWAVSLRTPHAWVACAVSALVLLVPPLGAVALPSQARLMLVVTPAVLCAALLRWQSAAVVTAVLAAAYVFVEVPGRRLETAVGTWPVVCGVMAVALVVPMLRRAARAVEASHRDLTVARERDAALQGRRHAHRQHQRLLHDRVSAALRALATTGGHCEEALALCRDAVGALVGSEQFPPGSDVVLADRLRKLAALVRTRAVIDLDQAAVAPVAVATATGDAVAEVLRNVDRHAHASRVEVGLVRVGDGFAVRVRDDGIGLPAGWREGGFGLRESVAARIGEVGGEVVVEDDPRGGTVVTISWRPDQGGAPPPSTPELLASTVGGRRAPVAAVAGTYLVGNAAVASSVLAHAERPWELVVWFAALSSATALLLLRGDRPVASWSAVGTVVALVTLEVLGLSLIPPDGLGTASSWQVGAIGSTLAVLAVLRPAWESIVVGVATEMGVVALLYASVLERPPWVALVTTMLSPLYGLVAGLVVAATLVRLARLISNDRTAYTTLLVARAAAQGRADLRERQTAEVGRDILLFLRTLLADPAEVGSARTRTRAAFLSDQVRDELHLPGVLNAAARSAVAGARARGCQVRLRADADAVDLPACINTALVAALADPTPSRMTLTVELVVGEVLVHLALEPGGEEVGARIEAALAHLAGLVDIEKEVVLVHLRG